MNIIEIIKRNIRKNSKIKLLNESIDKNKMIELFSRIQDLIGIADIDQNIQYINKGEYKTLKEVFNYQGNEIIYKDMIKACFESGSYSGDITLYVDGNKTIKNIFLYRMKDNILFLVRDLQKYIEATNSLEKQLKEKDENIKSKDLFIANLSHEIRTPMNIIIGMIYFLKATSLNDVQLEYIEKLEDSSNMLLEIVNNILTLSNNNKYNVSNKETNFNLKNLFDNINEIFEDKIKSKDLKWYMECDFDDDIMVYADKGRFAQIFINLINNSIKYTERGYIELDMKQVEETRTSYKLQFCLKDTGKGIKKEDTLKIFKEFSQIEDPSTKTQEGSGLGLAIAKKIIEDMDGKIWVESNYGLGSKFYFYIRIDKGKNEDETDELLIKPKVIVPKAVKIPGNNRILLVEDNKINVEITSKILTELNIVTDVAYNGTEAIKKIEDLGRDYYDLILMDIHMPKYNVYEISKIMRNDLGVEVPIIALTATNITDQTIEENKENISGYIQKPIKPNEFKQTIQSYLQKESDLCYKFSFIDKYDEFLQRINYDEKMETKLITLLYQDFSDIREKILNMTQEEKKFYLHTLKGALASLGAQKLSDDIKNIEDKINTPEAKELIENLLNKLDSIFKEIEQSNILKIDKTIMIVTTDEEKSTMLKAQMSKAFNIIIVKNMKEVEIILQASKIDAIVIDEFDVISNIMSLIQFLKYKYKEIPIIILNEKRNALLKEKVKDISVDSYLESNYDVQSLIWNIKNTIKHKQEEIKLKSDLKKYNNEIGNVYGFLYDSLVNLTSLKSKETGEHILRTKEYMKVMLRKYEEFYKEGLFADEKEIENISIAATLHDIGKVGIPDNILNKAGKLTDEEYEIMKSHTIIGRETLESTYSDKLSSEVLEYAKDITLHHHEKYNGTGYPEGLKGDEITIISRIMAIIDVYDALANDRVYKKAMPPKEVEEYIVSQSGTAFDPKLINVFLLAKDELARINKENQNKGSKLNHIS